MSIANLKSYWSSGNLIFARKASGTAASITIGASGATVNLTVNGVMDATSFSVGGTAGTDFTSGAITNLEVVNGLVTYAA